MVIGLSEISWLGLSGVRRKNSQFDGTRITSTGDFIGKATPPFGHRPPERNGRTTIDWNVPSRRMLLFL
jgi:hypothetical protein